MNGGKKETSVRLIQLEKVVGGITNPKKANGDSLRGRRGIRSPDGGNQLQSQGKCPGRGESASTKVFEEEKELRGGVVLVRKRVQKGNQHYHLLERRELQTVSFPK